MRASATRVAAAPFRAIGRGLRADQSAAVVSDAPFGPGAPSFAGHGRAGAAQVRQFASLCRPFRRVPVHSPTCMAAAGAAAPEGSTRLIVSSGQAAGMASSQGGDVELTAPAIAGVTGVIHDEAASQFVIRDSAAGTPAAFVEYSVAAGICECVCARGLDALAGPSRDSAPQAAGCAFAGPTGTRAHAAARSRPGRCRCSFAGGGCKGGTIDLFHTFSDPAFRGKVSERRAAHAPGEARGPLLRDGAATSLHTRARPCCARRAWQAMSWSRRCGSAETADCARCQPARTSPTS